MRRGLWAVVLVLAGAVAAVKADPGDERILEASDAAGRGDVARLATLAATPTDHVLEPYVQYWLLSARIARLTEPVDSQLVRGFLSANAGTPLAERLRGEWLRRLGFEKRWAEFEADYGLLQQPDLATQCYAIQGATSGAAEAKRALEAQWLSLLDVPTSCEIPLQNLVSEGRFAPEDVWQRFRRLVEGKRQPAARNALGWLDKSQQPSTAALNQVFDSPSRFLASAHSTARRIDRELILAAVARLARNDVRAAEQRWRAIENDTFRAEERAYAWGQLAWTGAQSRLPEAADWFRRARDTAMQPEQLNWSVRANLRNGDWRGVRRAIEVLPPEQRDTPEWSYWMGRALQALGENEAARQQFLRYVDQPSFYGILSTEALGRVFQWPRSTTPPSAAELAVARAKPEFRRAAALYRLDLRTEGMREWNWGLRGADDRQLLAAAEHARQLGLYDRAISSAERTRNEHDFALRYLAPYYESFARQAELQQLDLAWVYGLVRQESRFQPAARSGAGAQGLMQVMPATGKWVARKHGWGDYHAGWLNAVDSNLQVGSAYLRHVLDQLDNHRVLATAAYNAGPARARRWREDRALEGAIYIETIPFSETRDYVKKVMTNTEMYAVLFDRRPVSLGSRLGMIQPQGIETVAASGDKP